MIKWVIPLLEQINDQKCQLKHNKNRSKWKHSVHLSQQVVRGGQLFGHPEC